MKKLFITLFILSCCFCSYSQFSDKGFSFQGYAVDGDGLAIASKNITVKFTLSQSIGGSLTYTEEHTLTTDVYGVFSATVGEGTPAATGVPFSVLNFQKFHYRLKVEVKETVGGSFATISDEDLKAVPYARSAENGVPVGTIVAFGGIVNNIPDGWVLCDGRSLNSGDLEYTQLFNAIGKSWGGGATTFNVPDLRGRFLRGADNGRGEDPDAGARTAPLAGANSGDNVGSSQGDETRSHNHSASSSSNGDHTHDFRTYHANFGHSGGASEGSTKNDGDGEFNDPDAVGEAGAHTHTISIANTGGNETRPENSAVNYIIKY